MLGKGPGCCKSTEAKHHYCVSSVLRLHLSSDFKLGSVRLIPHFKLLNFLFYIDFSPTLGWAPADGACSSAALRLQLVIPPLPVGLSVSVVCGHGSHTPLWCSADCNTLHYIIDLGLPVEGANERL